WLQKVLQERKIDVRLEKLWGSHRMLAPYDYGIIVLDYMNNVFISAQDYTSPTNIVRWEDDPEKIVKWDALQKADLLCNVQTFRESGPFVAGASSATVKLPFN